MKQENIMNRKYNLRKCKSNKDIKNKVLIFIQIKLINNTIIEKSQEPFIFA